MNCQEFSDLIDVQDAGALGMPVREAFEAHAARCHDCAAALSAADALRAELLPLRWRELPAQFAPRVFAQLGAAQLRRPRRRQRTLIFGLAGIGTLSFAALGLWQVMESAETPPTAMGAVSEQKALEREVEARPAPAELYLRDILLAAETQAQSALSANGVTVGGGPESLLADGEFFVLLRFPPEYPAEAAALGIEGSTIVEFTVTETGDVAEAQVLESTNALFDEPSLVSVSATKYKPRVVDGRAVAVTGVRNKIVFALSLPPQEGEDGERPRVVDAPNPEPGLPATEFWDKLAPTVACIELGDFVCTEIKLDEFAATHALNRDQQAFVQRIYGYVHLRRGDYERALEAYEAALAAAGPGDSTYNSIALMTIARIHYERRQYQDALNYAIEYLKHVKRPTLADYVFVDRLRQLGAVVR